MKQEKQEEYQAMKAEKQARYEATRVERQAKHEAYEKMKAEKIAKGHWKQ